MAISIKRIAALSAVGFAGVFAAASCVHNRKLEEETKKVEAEHRQIYINELTEGGTRPPTPVENCIATFSAKVTAPEEVYLRTIKDPKEREAAKNKNAGERILNGMIIADECRRKLSPGA